MSPWLWIAPAAVVFALLTWRTVGAWRAGRRWVVVFPVVALFISPIVWQVIDESDGWCPRVIAALACVVLCGGGWALAVSVRRSPHRGAPA